MACAGSRVPVPESAARKKADLIRKPNSTADQRHFNTRSQKTGAPAPTAGSSNRQSFAKLFNILLDGGAPFATYRSSGPQRGPELSY